MYEAAFFIYLSISNVIAAATRVLPLAINLPIAGCAHASITQLDVGA